MLAEAARPGILRALVPGGEAPRFSCSSRRVPLGGASCRWDPRPVSRAWAFRRGRGFWRRRRGRPRWQ
eukprot:1449894-Pyramimonas_sp.AAC.1